MLKLWAQYSNELIIIIVLIAIKKKMVKVLVNEAITLLLSLLVSQ